MILNVSGRTDIPAFYSEWFINRYREGYVDVRNPFNQNFVSRIYFEDVDLILFCSKNPLPIIKYLNQIDKPIIFHITLTSYKNDIEPNVPPKEKIIEGIKKISKIIGRENTVVRYDPILINEKYNINYHIKAFQRICDLLGDYVSKIIISFIDDYKNVRNNYKDLKLKEFSEDDYKNIGINFTRIAKEKNIVVHTCFEDKNLEEYGMPKGECLSHELVFKMTGKTGFKNWTARKERRCNCVQMVDIGVYNSCSHFCKYCYANFDEKKVKENMLNHDKKSSLLIGNLKEDDTIKIRRV